MGHWKSHIIACFGSSGEISGRTDWFDLSAVYGEAVESVRGAFGVGRMGSSVIEETRSSRCCGSSITRFGPENWVFEQVPVRKFAPISPSNTKFWTCTAFWFRWTVSVSAGPTERDVESLLLLHHLNEDPYRGWSNMKWALPGCWSGVSKKFQGSRPIATRTQACRFYSSGVWVDNRRAKLHHRGF